MSTLPTYEKRPSSAPIGVAAAHIENLYRGHFSRMGTRDGRAMVRQPMGRWYQDRFKSFKQLEYSLPPGMKEFR